jgi:hypothetical protein
MNAIGKNEVTQRELYLLSLPTLQDPLPNLELPAPYFGAFLVCDADQIADTVIVELAHSLLRQGLVYLCVWGKDCERVHDLFDDVIVELDPCETDESVRMTTWLDRVSLDEALWHFLCVAFPADHYRENCKAELIVVAGDERMASQIRARLTGQSALRYEVSGDDDDKQRSS